MNEEVGNRRLLKLAEFLKTVPRKNFDYGVWWHGHQPDRAINPAKQPECGTRACAMGWATQVPSLRKAGLLLSEYDIISLHNPETGEYITGGGITPAMCLFGLNSTEAGSLFLPEGDEIDATPKQVARKIEKFVAKRRRQAARTDEDAKLFWPQSRMKIAT